MKTLLLELRQIAHSRLAVGAVVLLALLSALSVWTGLHAVSQQRATLERIAASHAHDRAAILATQLRAVSKTGSAEAGAVGYYLPHLTVNPPSPLAFAPSVDAICSRRRCACASWGCTRSCTNPSRSIRSWPCRVASILRSCWCT